MASEWREMEVDGRSHRTMSVRIYDAPGRGKAPPLVLYLGGGSFLEDERGAESPIARCFAGAGAVVVEADYAAPSGNAFPEALEYAFAALRCLSGKRRHFGSQRSSLLVAGVEAGGNVAAAVALKARDYQMAGEIDGQILLSPLIDPLMATPSFREAGGVGMLERWTEGWNHYLGATGGCCHPYAAPGHCSRLAGVAPALIVTSADDPLRDEAANYAARLQTAGVAVRQCVLPACQGWTQIYGNRPTAQCEPPAALREEFGTFVRDLESGTFCHLR